MNYSELFRNPVAPPEMRLLQRRPSALLFYISRGIMKIILHCLRFNSYLFGCKNNDGKSLLKTTPPPRYKHVRVNSKNSTHDILTRTVSLAEVHLAEMHHIFCNFVYKVV